MLKITCPRCQEGFEVPESLRGQDERCPVCGHAFHVEAPLDTPGKPRKRRLAWLTKGRARRIVFWIGAGLIVLMGLFPPWVQTSCRYASAPHQYKTHYAFLLIGPADAPNGVTLGNRIDITRLLVQCGLVAVLAAVGTCSLKARTDTAHEGRP